VHGGTPYHNREGEGAHHPIEACIRSPVPARWTACAGRPAVAARSDKGGLKIDAWIRDLGPRDKLRKWFGHDPARWEGFRRRYLRELARKKALLQELAVHARRGKLTLVYSAHDPDHNQAVVIREVLGGDRGA
jgi:uncharacterized protein YeaO (DUF488 family)